MTAFEKYLRKRLAEDLARYAFYGTSDPEEIARMEAKGAKLRGLPEHLDSGRESC